MLLYYVIGIINVTFAVSDVVALLQVLLFMLLLPCPIEAYPNIPQHHIDSCGLKILIVS